MSAIVRLVASIAGSLLAAAIPSQAEQRARALEGLDDWYLDGGPAAEWRRPCLQANN